MRDDKRQTVKIELLSQWKPEAEFRNFKALSFTDTLENFTLD